LSPHTRARAVFRFPFLKSRAKSSERPRSERPSSCAAALLHVDTWQANAIWII
jgi:hypothetical protein